MLIYFLLNCIGLALTLVLALVGLIVVLGKDLIIFFFMCYPVVPNVLLKRVFFPHLLSWNPCQKPTGHKNEQREQPDHSVRV